LIYFLVRFIAGRPGQGLPGFPKPQKMKYLKYIAPALFLLAFAAGCSAPQPMQFDVQATPSFWQNLTAFTTDTLTNADTATYSLGTYNRPVSVEVQISADSLSGSTAATATLEQSIAGSDWFIVDTETINGVTSRLKATGDLLGGTLRLRVISSGTQSTALRMDAIIADSAPAQ